MAKQTLRYGTKKSQNTFKVSYRVIIPGSAESATVGSTFMTAPWVFAEAYKYRRLRESFSISKHWKEYDVFFRQKVRSISSVCLLWIPTVQTSAIPFHAQKTQYLSSPCGSRKSINCPLVRMNKRPKRRNVSCSTNSRRVGLHPCIPGFLLR